MTQRQDQPRRRFFVTPGALAREVFVFAPREAHHIAHVVRLGPGDRVLVFDGEWEAEAELLEVAGARVTARSLGEPRRSPRPTDITLLQGVVRGAKMDLIVRMGTEIGLAAIRPVVTQRSVADPGSARVDRWRRIAREAAKQCGRGDLPEIAPPARLDQVLAMLGPVDLLLVPWEEETRPVGHVLAGRRYVSAAVLIGPEGGLTRSEVEAARAAGGEIASLGPMILRTETAGLAATAMMIYEARLRPRS